MNKKQIMYDRISHHGKDIIRIFRLGDVDPIQLCKTLRRYETKLNKLAVDYCNGDTTEEVIDIEGDKILTKVNKLLGNTNGKYCCVFFNRDPRGYSLKIHDQDVVEKQLLIYRDWGGYGILAPDFRE